MPVTIPTRPEELEDFLGDPAKVRSMMTEPGKFKEFIGVYAQTVVNKDQDIKEQVQIGLAEFMKTNGQAYSVNGKLSGGHATQSNFQNAQHGPSILNGRRTVSTGKGAV